jgi:hypothetical protein
VIGGNAAKDSASAQLEGTKESIAAQKENTDKAIAFLGQQAAQSRQDLAPFQQAQTQALGQLQSFTDPNSAFYQQQRTAATNAIQRQLAAQGLLRSSAQGGQLQQLELGLGQQRLNIIGGLAGNGAAQSLSSISQGLGQNVAGLYGGLGQGLGSSFMAGGQATAQGILGSAGAAAGGLNAIGNAAQGTLGNFMAYNQQQSQLSQLSRLLGGGSAGYTVPNYNPAQPYVAGNSMPGPWAR